MPHDINIKEVIDDKKSWYNIKRFKVGGLSFERPVKTLDIKDVTFENFDNTNKSHKFTIFEASRVIKDFSVIIDIQNEEEDKKLNAFFYKKIFIQGKPLLNFTLNFNPLKSIKRIEDIGGFLNFYHQYSEPFLCVPNIRKFKIQAMPYKKETIIESTDYMNFVDSTYDYLNKKNNKHLFVPVSLRMSANDLKLLAEHYCKKEYFYYWFDFEGKSINEASIARVNQFMRFVEEKGYWDKTITYFTNIKREILSNVKEDRSPASDVLASIVGANIIGVDREPPRYIEGPLPPIAVEHKARVFDRNSYYYIKTGDKRQLKKGFNVSQNAIKLDDEFEQQATYFLNKQEMEQFLKNKEMLSKYKEGNILKSLLSKKTSTQRTLNWY